MITAFALLPALGCSLGLDFDRSKIGAGSDSGVDASIDAATPAKDAGKDAAVKDAAADATTSDATVAVDSGFDAGDDSGGPECDVPSDCGTDKACKFFECTAHKCVEKNRANGVLAVGVQVAGNCHRIECDGTGALNNVVDDTDVPVDGKECTQDVCSAGTASNPAVAADTACSTGFCDGVDACVACNIPSHCGTNDDCKQFTCTGHVCGTTFTAANTALSAGNQTPGDCKERRCDGAGGELSPVPALPGDNNDNNECTTDSCSGNSDVHTAVSDSTPCTQGGAFCKAGVCAGCAVASDCGSDTECRTFTCTNAGTCQINDLPTSTSIGGQTANDCKLRRCNGSGAVEFIADTADTPVDDGNQCTSDTCNGQTPEHNAVSDGMTCNQNGGTKCNAGTCGVCVAAGDCGANTECRSYTCLTGGMCQTNNVGNNTPLASGNQTAGDCAELQCNGAGGIKAVDKDTDVPGSDGDPCTADACDMGVPYPAATINTVCTGGFCDGNKNCVDCNMDSQCTPAICIDHACIPGDNLTAVSANHASLVAGASGSVTLSFTTASVWGGNGVLSIVFPSGYSVASATLASLTGASGSQSLQVSGNEVLITRTSGVTAAAGAFTVQLDNVRNPQVSGSAGTIAIATRTGAGVDIDTGSTGSATITPGAITSLSVTPSATTPSTMVNVALAGTGTNPWPKNGALTIVFPAGFDVSAAMIAGGTGADGTFTIQINGQTVAIVRNDDGTATAGGTPFTLDIGNVITPAATGMTADYVVTSFTFSDVAIDTGTAAGTDIQ